MKLNGKQNKQLLDALISAFPTTNTLGQMVKAELNENLNAIAGGGSLVDTTFDLIRWADAQGRLDDLVHGAADYNPGNIDLQAFVNDIWNPLQHAGPASNTVATPPAPSTSAGQL